MGEREGEKRGEREKREGGREAGRWAGVQGLGSQYTLSKACPLCHASSNWSSLPQILPLVNCYRLGTQSSPHETSTFKVKS